MSTTRILKVEEVLVDKELYPRSTVNWHTAYQYSQSMEAGAEFPPIKVALLNGKYFLIDGAHRQEAHRLNKKTHIQTLVFEGLSRKQIFLESINENIGHGKPFSAYDKTRMTLKLREFKLSDADISRIVQIPLGKLEKFVATRVTQAVNGSMVPLKKSVRHMSKGPVSTDFMTAQKNIQGQGQVELVNQVINLLEKQLLNLDNKTVIRRLRKLADLIKSEIGE